MIRRVLVAVFAAAALLAVLAPGASAHAQLVSSSPARDAVVRTQPGAVVLRFSESVEGRFGAIKVFDADAARVDDGATRHPDGEGAALQSGLRPGLPDGTYTATYRIVSADGHPVAGGVVFSIGRPGATSAKTIDELIGTTAAGPLTRVPFGVVRSLDSLATGLAVGLLVFLLACWRRGLAQVAGAGADWRQAAAALADRAGSVLLLTAGLGLLAALLGLVFAGASAAGTSFWGALDLTILRDVASTRFGTVWALKALAWVALAGALLVRAPRRALVLRPAALGADGQALASPGAGRVLALGLPVLALAPALAGHASTQGDARLLVPAAVVHVLAMSVWLGGLAALLLLVPKATARLAPGDRTRLLAAVLLRFSPLALGAVLALSLTGTIQAIVHLDALGDLLDDAFGRAVLVKVLLLLGLVGLGAVNRRRALPRLRALAADGAAPGAPGHLLRRTLRLEAGTLLVVLAVTGALVGYAPPGATAGAQGGSAGVSARLGPYALEATVDPARTGANTVHLYLFDARDGTPFDGTKQLTVTAVEQEQGIGPLPVGFQKTGPGHYTADLLLLVPGGAWTFFVTARVSEFDQYTKSFTVEVGG